MDVAADDAAVGGVKRPRDNDQIEIRNPLGQPKDVPTRSEDVSIRHKSLIEKTLLSHWVDISHSGPEDSANPAAAQSAEVKKLSHRLHSLLRQATAGQEPRAYAEVLKRMICALQSHSVLTAGLQSGITSPHVLVDMTVSNSIGHLLALSEAQSQLSLVHPNDEVEAASNPHLAHNLQRLKQLPALESQLPHILTFLLPCDLAAFSLATRLFLPVAWSDVIWHALLWRDLGPLQPQYYEVKGGVLCCLRTGHSSFSSLQQPAINLSHLGIGNSRRHRDLRDSMGASGAAALPRATAASTTTLPPSSPTDPPPARASTHSSTAGDSAQQSTRNVYSSSYFSVPDSFLRRRSAEDSFRDVYKRASSHVSHRRAVYDSVPKITCESCGQATAIRRMKSQMLRTIQYAECVMCRHVWTLSISDGGVKDIIRDMFGSEGIH